MLAPKGIATGLNKGHLVVKRAVKLNKKTGKPAALSRGIRSKGVRITLFLLSSSII